MAFIPGHFKTIAEMKIRAFTLAIDYERALIVANTRAMATVMREDEVVPIDVEVNFRKALDESESRVLQYGGYLDALIKKQPKQN